MQAVGLGLVVSFPLPLIVESAGGVTWRAVPWWGPAAAVLTRAECVPWQMGHVCSSTSSPHRFVSALPHRAGLKGEKRNKPLQPRW